MEKCKTRIVQNVRRVNGDKGQRGQCVFGADRAAVVSSEKIARGKVVDGVQMREVQLVRSAGR